MTDADREFNGRMILDMCEMGERILDQYADDIRKIRKQSTPPEKYGRLTLVKPDAEIEQEIIREQEAEEEWWSDRIADDEERA